MDTRKHLLTAAVLAVVCGVVVNATRPAPEPQGLPDPATMRLEYRPGAYMAPGFPLHGSVKLLTSPVAEMGRRTRVRIEYTVGDMPIETGMSLEIWKHFTSDVEEFQTNDANEPAFFGADATAAGVELEERAFTNYVQRNDPSVFPYRKTAGVLVRSGSLGEGDKVTFDLGGTQGVRMQHYEENLFNFRVVIVNAADGKVLGYGGDAVMKITGGPLRQLRVQAPSIVGLGEKFSLEVVPLDEWGSLAKDFRDAQPRIVSGDGLGSDLEYEPDLTHYVARNLVANQEGTLRVEVEARGGVRGVSNPIWVEREPVRRVFYGDLHQHTYLHDGRGVYEELYLYARRVGLLDFGSITPHHMPMSVTGPQYYLDDYRRTVDNWPDLVQANKIMKGWKQFVPILGYEYSVGTAAGGHHNVIFKDDEASTTMALDPANVRAPVGDMMKILDRGRSPAMVIPHIGGGPPDWEHPTDPRLERMFEIASVHGVFEESYQKHLEAGVRLAATASGDVHTTSFGSAYPGLNYITTNPLTGVYAHGKSREAIWDGMYQRQTFGVTGNTRILMQLDVNGEPMGGELALGHHENARIRARVSGTAPLVRLDILKNSRVIHSVAPSRNRGRLLRVSWGDNIYQRRAVVGLSDGELQADGGSVRLERVLHRDQAFESIRQNGARVQWRTAATSNDRDSFLADISDATGAVHFRLDDPLLGRIEIDIPLEKLKQDGYFSWTGPGSKPFEHSYMKKMGVEVAFTLECELLNDQGPMDYDLAYEDREPLKPGDYYYLRMEQLDTNKGWTSPVWVN